ncbi:MAG: hypothetical protein HY738_24165 [Bacteroidia bacterium]|nr:hypothetical protein [Bacteroidia bacterium]
MKNALINASNDKNESIRSSAMNVMTMKKDPDNVELLIKALKDKKLKITVEHALMYQNK